MQQIAKSRAYVWGTIALAAIVILVLFGSNTGENSTPELYSTGALAVSESSFDFGNVPINGGDVYHEFSVKNTGTERVVIQRVYTSCGCTTAALTDASGNTYGPFGMPGHGFPLETNIEIPPTETITVKAIFDPAAHGPSGIGLAERSVYLETNSAQSPKLELSFRAVVTP